VCSFIAGLFIGAFLGIILFSLLAAGKQNGISYDMGPGSKAKHPFADQAEKDISNG
jgi:hypothetical protein